MKSERAGRPPASDLPTNEILRASRRVAHGCGSTDPLSARQSSGQGERKPSSGPGAKPRPRRTSQSDLGGTQRPKSGPTKGRVRVGGNPARPVLDRFLEQVDRSRSEGHWLWTGPLVRGRGRLKVAGKVENAARVAWVLFVGPIPLGARVHNECGLSGCVAPEHLVMRKRGHRTPKKPRPPKLGPRKPRSRRSVTSRLWDNVVALPAPPSCAHLGPCLVAPKPKPTSRGYVMLLIEGNWHPAHRLGYELAHGVKLPKSVVTDHLCSRKECRSPLHIEPVTQAENLRRARLEYADRLALARAVSA